MWVLLDNCIMHEDNYYYKLIAVYYLHDDQTDGNI